MLVASVDCARGFHRLGEAAADGAEDEGGDGALGRQGEIGGFVRKFDATVEPQAGFAEEFRGETHIFGAIDSPKPELFLMALEEIHRLLELFHGFVEVGSQVKDPEKPSVAWIADADADAVLP